MFYPISSHILCNYVLIADDVGFAAAINRKYGLSFIYPKGGDPTYNQLKVITFAQTRTIIFSPSTYQNITEQH